LNSVIQTETVLLIFNISSYKIASGIHLFKWGAFTKMRVGDW